MDGHLTIGGLAVRCRVEGEGPDLVLIHGVGGRLEVWDGVVARLAGRRRTIRYDLRGHGESGKPPGPYELADFVADLVGLMDRLGLDRPDVAGFSLGGLVAQGLALAHPRRVRRLALLSTVAGRTEEEKARVLGRLETVASGIPGAHFENSVGRWFTDEFRAAHPEVVALHAARNRANDPAAYAAAYRVLATGDLADRLAEIAAPTLVATGEHDVGSNTRMARLMHERIAGSRLHVFPGLRHSILVEAPGDVAALLDDFLAAPEPAGGRP